MASTFVAGVRRGVADLDDLVVCRCCGHETRRRRLSSPRYSRVSLGAVRYRAPGDCEPEEYVTSCPDCGEDESFE